MKESLPPSNTIYEDDLVRFTMTFYDGNLYMASHLKGKPKLSDFHRMLDVFAALSLELQSRGFDRIYGLVRTPKDKRWNEFLGAHEVAYLPEFNTTIMMKELKSYERT